MFYYDFLSILSFSDIFSPTWLIRKAIYRMTKHKLVSECRNGHYCSLYHSNNSMDCEIVIFSERTYVFLFYASETPRVHSPHAPISRDMSTVAPAYLPDTMGWV
jgi:hypothetical protein